MAEGTKNSFDFKKILAIALVFIVLISISGVIAYFVAVKAVLSEGKEKNTEEKEPVRGIMVSGGEFTTNLRDKGIIKISIEYEVKDEEVKKEVESKRSIIKDKVIAVLRSLKYDEVNGYTGMENLRSDIKQVLNSIFKKDEIMEVYITDIIVF